ncbi:ATP-binding protein [Acuticoccus sediminis]|uniref:ATP-binding protein n=1 Tax=Acuticoccus sediminis TaxID=2184697 RepID=UPI001CFE8A46|nr:ATP-binding protein [Acuticoccus sediminis]
MTADAAIPARVVRTTRGLRGGTPPAVDAAARPLAAIVVDDLLAARSALRDEDVLLVTAADFDGTAWPNWLVRRARHFPVVALADPSAGVAFPDGAAVVADEAALAAALPLLARHSELLHRARLEIRGLSQVFDTIPDAVIVLDKDGGVRRANAAARTMFADADDDMTGENMAFSVGPDGTGEIEFFREGLPRVGEIRLAEIEWEKAAATLALVRDVTTAADLQARLAQSQKSDAIRLMAGGIAHEFNNMLLVAMTNLYFLRSHLNGGEPELLLDKVDNVVERARALASQILVLSQSHTSRTVEVDLGELVRDHMPVLRSGVRREIDVIINLSRRPLPVVVDQEEIRQVLTNLVLNAMHVTNAGGRITVETGTARGSPGGLAEGEWSTLTVTDSGAGMPSEVLPLIFDPFYTTKPVGEGRGLGLSVSRSYVRKAGGTIIAESEEGKGSVFTVYLPLAEPIVLRQDSNGAANGEATHVLLLEDDSDVALVLRKALERDGYRVTSRGNGLDGKDLIEEDPSIGLVVSDVVMPHLGGNDLAQWLMYARPSMKVLLITGYSDRVDWLEAIKDEAHDYLIKPFPPAKFLSTVRQLLRV